MKTRLLTFLAMAATLLGMPNASAILISNSRLLGTVVPSTPANLDAEIERVRFLVAALNAGTPGVVAFPGTGINLGDNGADGGDETYTLWAPAGLATPAPLPTGTHFTTDTSNTTLNLGTLQYDYLLGKFGNSAVVFWIGGLTGELTIPNLVNTNGLSGYSLFNQSTGPGPGPNSTVPDGGATVALLGLALGGLGFGRLLIKKA